MNFTFPWESMFELLYNLNIEYDRCRALGVVLHLDNDVFEYLQIYDDWLHNCRVGGSVVVNRDTL